MGGGVVTSERGGKRRRSRAKRKPMAEINVTPFVDVMLVLLIIFMVAAPLLTVGVPIELPETAANALPTEEEEPLTITVTAEGQVLIQNTEITRSELIPKLQAGGEVGMPVPRMEPHAALKAWLWVLALFHQEGEAGHGLLC